MWDEGITVIFLNVDDETRTSFRNLYYNAQFSLKGNFCGIWIEYQKNMDFLWPWDMTRDNNKMYTQICVMSIICSRHAKELPLYSTCIAVESGEKKKMVKYHKLYSNIMQQDGKCSLSTPPASRTLIFLKIAVAAQHMVEKTIGGRLIWINDIYRSFEVSCWNSPPALITTSRDVEFLLKWLVNNVRKRF